MALPCTVKVLEHCHVSPPLNSVPTTSLPLTFFDIPSILFGSVQRIYFYEYSHSIVHFMNTILPSLKHSLSRTLQHFFPLAGTLTCPPHPSNPYILYTAGDSVSLTVAESTGNFAHLLSNYPRHVREFHSLVPQISSSCVSTDAHKEVVLIAPLALQLTIFPNVGVCIGITYSHGALDGRTSNHFMKSWAFIFRSQGDLSCIDDKSALPFYDRSVIKDSKGLSSIFWNQWWTWRSSFCQEDTAAAATTTTTSAPPPEDMFRATFIMSRHHIEKLKQWLLPQCENDNETTGTFHLSTFVVTCAFIWVCLIRSQDRVMITNNKSLDDDDDKILHFVFVADCRNRDEICVPITYFGNCLTFRGHVSATREELVGENGMVVAAKGIGSEVKELESGALQGAENWMSYVKEVLGFRHVVSAAGSPKLRLYETDFGWGRPKKIEVVHFDSSGPISLAECRDEEGGIEVGVALGKDQMEAFSFIFEEGRKSCLNVKLEAFGP